MPHKDKQCANIRAKNIPDQQCSHKSKPNSDWCGKHQNPKSQIRFQGQGQGQGQGIHIYKLRLEIQSTQAPATAIHRIQRAWLRWIARRAGPLLHFRECSNNPHDFLTSDDVTKIPFGNVISFVDRQGSGYIFDIQSSVSLLEHARQSGIPPLNPFNREPLPAIFLHRVRLHQRHSASALVPAPVPAPVRADQMISLGATDLFQAMNDLGNYTNPAWFLDLELMDLQRMYIELADIWFHRAGLSQADRTRIGAGRPAITIPVKTIMRMTITALRAELLSVCKRIATSAEARADRQLGTMYVLGALSLVSAPASLSIPWLTESFSPSVTRIVRGHLMVVHPAVLNYP